MDLIKIGKYIAGKRKELGMTQRQLAEKLGMSDKSVSKWERGMNYPDISRLEAISQALDCTIIELLGIEDSSPREVAEVITELSMEEIHSTANDIVKRAIFSLLVFIILTVCSITASYIFSKNNLYGVPQVITIGVLPLNGFLIGNSISLIRNGLIVRKKS